ncbi:MAG: LysR family transcriptional regulator [Gammaproteobacteria bacterium]|nr:LysR family transcriptional regulator [Gammaproteobacteria bacterium]
MSRLSLKQIEYFRAVMETGTVSGAAALLHVSQPNVSRMLKYTESRLGLGLFQREHGRLLATPEAHALFREVQSLHLHLESVQEAVDRIASGQLDRFPVGASPSLGRFVVPSLLSRLRRDFPSLPIKLDILSVSQVMDYLAYGQGECACTIFPVADPRIESQTFATGALVCAVPRDHRLSGAAAISPQDITGETLIAFDANTPHGRVVAQFFGQAPMPRIACTVRFAESACALAEQGNGIALVDEFTVSGGAFPNLVAVPVRFRRPFRIYFHRASERPLSAAGVRLRELLSRWQ